MNYQQTLDSVSELSVVSEDKTKKEKVVVKDLQ